MSLNAATVNSLRVIYPNRLGVVDEPRQGVRSASRALVAGFEEANVVGSVAFWIVFAPWGASLLYLDRVFCSVERLLLCGASVSLLL